MPLVIERYFALVGRDHPSMAEGIENGACAIAPIFILDRPQQFGARGDSLARQCVNIRNIDVDHNRRSANLFGTLVAPARTLALLGEHDKGMAHVKLGIVSSSV